jgi:hypothetical protein
MHPARSYMGLAPDLQFDAGLVDTFLHGRNVSYSIDECIDLVTSAGLVFQDIFIKSPYYPPLDSTSAFHSYVAALPEAKQWSIMERINFRNACHFFMACRTERPDTAYRIDFRSKNVFDYVLSLRHRCSLDGAQLSRSDWSMKLDPAQLGLVRRVNGSRTIGDIFSDASQSGVLAEHPRTDSEKFVRGFFQSLWQLDFLAIGLKPDYESKLSSKKRIS